MTKSFCKAKLQIRQ